MSERKDVTIALYGDEGFSLRMKSMIYVALHSLGQHMGSCMVMAPVVSRAVMEMGNS